MASRLKPVPRRLLLAVHLLCACSWVGGIVALLLLSTAFRSVQGDGALSAIRHAMKLVDYGVIIPACFGSLFTGIAFMALTNWGFTRHSWVIVKWSATSLMIAFGAACLGPWVDSTASVAARLGSAALESAEYQATAANVTRYAALQLGLLVTLVVVSSLKPWGKRARRVASEPTP
jgi:uncharacterized membrane protein